MLKSKMLLLYLNYRLIKNIVMLYLAWLTHNILLIILATGFLIFTISLLLNFKKVEHWLNQRALKKRQRKEAHLHAKSKSMD